MDKGLLKQCRENPESVDWEYISINQVLSENFKKEFKITKEENNG